MEGPTRRFRDKRSEPEAKAEVHSHFREDQGYLQPGFLNPSLEGHWIRSHRMQGCCFFQRQLGR